MCSMSLGNTKTRDGTAIVKINGDRRKYCRRIKFTKDAQGIRITFLFSKLINRRFKHDVKLNYIIKLLINTYIDRNYICGSRDNK